MPASKPLVGVVLVNFNGLKFLPACVSSLANQTHDNLKVVIVDNASTDGSREWIERQPSEIERVLLDSNTGITGGNNAGIKRCQELGCDEIFILNNDTELEPDCVEKLIAAREPKCLLVPKIYFYSDRNLINNNFGDFDFVKGISRHYFYGQPDSEASQKTQYGTMTSTCALLVPSEAFASIGTMDDKYFIYWDDTDFAARAVKTGYKIKFVPEAVLYHKESMSSGGDKLGPLPLYYLTRNRLYFMEKNSPSPLSRLAFRFYFSVTAFAKSVLWRLRGNRQALFAMHAGIRDYRKRKLGYADPKVYKLES